MNTTQIEFAAAEAGQSQNDILAAHFQSHPNEWLAMPDLARVAGCYAVHSRAAELRRRGMRIENRRQCQPGSRKQHSFYRFVPGAGPPS